MDYLRSQIAQNEAMVQSIVPPGADIAYWLVIVLFIAIWLHLGYKLFLHPKR